MNPEFLSPEEYTSGIAVLTAKIERLEDQLCRLSNSDGSYSRAGLPARPALDSAKTPGATIKNFSLLHNHAFRLERLLDLATEKTSATPPGQKTGVETQAQPAATAKKYAPDAAVAEHRAKQAGQPGTQAAEDQHKPAGDGKAKAWNPDEKILSARGVTSLIELRNLPPTVAD